MKRKHIIFLVVLAVVLVGAALIKLMIDNIDKQLKGITVNDVDITEIADGIYQGSYSAFPVSASVSVTVRDHAITAIELLEHNHGQGGAAEVIPDRLLEEQSLLVDTVSGATYSSKVILKAIENALAGANESS